MNNIKIFMVIMFSLLFILGCEQNNGTPVKLRFIPNASPVYYLKMNTSRVTLDIKVETNISHRNDSTLINSTIKEIKVGTEGEFGAEIQGEYQKYINTSFLEVFDVYGNNLQSQSPTSLINIELLVVEFPEGEVAVGDTWQGKKSSAGDMAFDYITTNYTCREIGESETIIDVEMDFAGGGNAIGGLNLSKKYKGYYVVNNSDGMVKKARFDISGSSGISEIKGLIEISILD